MGSKHRDTQHTDINNSLIYFSLYRAFQKSLNPNFRTLFILYNVTDTQENHSKNVCGSLFTRPDNLFESRALVTQFFAQQFQTFAHHFSENPKEHFGSFRRR